MKIRFWQKTYILTLVLFLLCLYTGIFSLAFYTYQRSVKSAKDVCCAEADYIAMSFEKDYDTMMKSGPGASPSLLMQSYGQNYEKQEIYLSFQNSKNTVFSSFDPQAELSDVRGVSEKRFGTERHILVASEICSGEYMLIYGKYAGDLDAEFKTMMITYTLVALGVSTFLAVTLLLVLKKLSVPLEKLRTATEMISNGDMNVLADEAGKDEFSVLAKSFNRMVATINLQMEELTEESQRKQLLVDNMAHEMRTPLTSIRGYAEYIEKAAVPAEEKDDAARRIISETDRLKRISEKLLDTAVLRENAIETKPVNLLEILSEVAVKLSLKAEERGVNIITELNDSVVNGDDILLSMLFYNLTENAIKACATSGAVTLFCEGKTAYVSDNGKGMTEEQLSHIVEPFYRTDKSRSRAEGGAGLGLALCKQIAESHGATMQFESELGKGTKVFLHFTV